MNTIEVANYGVRLRFAGEIKAAEAKHWHHQSARLMVPFASYDDDFNAFVNLCQVEAISLGAISYLLRGLNCYRVAGVDRIAVIVSSNDVRRSFARLLARANLHEGACYLNSDEIPSWEKKGLVWVGNQNNR